MHARYTGPVPPSIEPSLVGGSDRVARNCDSKKWRHDVRYEIAYPPEARGARRAPMLVLWQAQRAMRETRSRPRRVHLQVHRPCRGRTGEIPLSGHYVDGCDGWVPKTWSRAMSRKTGFLKGGVAGRRRQKDTSLARRSFLGLCSFITGLRETACHSPNPVPAPVCLLPTSCPGPAGAGVSVSPYCRGAAGRMPRGPSV